MHRRASAMIFPIRVRSVSERVRICFSKTHRRITGKGNNYNIRGMISGCRQVVKFVGTVKNYLTVSKDMNFFICLNPGSSFIYTLKFPEIMLFIRIGKVIAVFKVMNGIIFLQKDLWQEVYFHIS